MSRRSSSAAVAVLASLALAAPAAADSRDPINAYRVKASPQNLEKLALAGFDVTEGSAAGRSRSTAPDPDRASSRARDQGDAGPRPQGPHVGSAPAQRGLRRPRAPTTGVQGVDAATTACAGDGKEQYLELYDRPARSTRGSSKQLVVGDTDDGPRHRRAQGHAQRAQDDGRQRGRPCSTTPCSTRASGWPARRAAARSTYFVDNYGKRRARHAARRHARAVVRVRRQPGRLRVHVHARQPPVAQEHGRQRRRRRPRRADDGVDPNRNFPVNWGLDDEGSSPRPDVRDLPRPGAGLRAGDPGDAAAVGPRRLRVPEERPHGGRAAAVSAGLAAVHADRRRRDLHGAGRRRPQPGDPGRGFDPDLGAELYITNGDTLDTAYNREGILAYTPEGTVPQDPTVSGFEFEDAERESRRSSSATCTSRSTSRSRPTTRTTRSRTSATTVEDFYVDPFADSYGDPQPVQVTAKRSLGAVELHYRINGGREQTVEDDASGATASATTRRRASTTTACAVWSTGTQPGDEVEVWFARRPAASARRASPTTARVESRQPRAGDRRRGLHRPDAGPGPRRGPHYADELPGGARGQRRRRRPLRRRRARHDAPRIRWACSSTTTP